MDGAKFITDKKGETLSVVLPITEYERLLELLEEKEDVKLYDEVKAKNEKTISLETYLAKRKKRAND